LPRGALLAMCHHMLKALQLDSSSLRFCVHARG
jgi:hypothetical protein